MWNEKVSDQFEFEQQLLECWKITSDLELLRKRHLDEPTPMTEDELDNFHMALITLYEHKFENLFKMFEMLVSSGKLT